MSINVSAPLEQNVVNVGDEISTSQLAAITSSTNPSGTNPFITSSAQTSTLSNYLTTASASSTYQSISGMSNYTSNANLNLNRMSPAYRCNFSGAGFTQVVSGTGATTSTDYGIAVASGTGASAYAIRRIGGSTSVFHQSSALGIINFNKEIELSFNIIADGLLASDQTFRLTLGKVSTDNNGALTRRGFGFRIAGSGVASLQTHNGTTLTNTDSTWQTVANVGYDVRIISNSGTVTLFINDVQVATTSTGPTGNSAASTHNNLQIEIENVTAPALGKQITVSGITMRFAR